MSKRFMAAGFVVAAALFVTVTYGAVVSADHPWGNYHWARTSPVVPFSFDLTVINSTTPDWDWYVSKALTDWSNAPAGVDQVINMVHDENGSTRKKVRRQCRAPSGAFRICNLAYGATGWMGIGVSDTASVPAGRHKCCDPIPQLSRFRAQLVQQREIPE